MKYELLKQTDEIRVEDEEQAKELIEQFKQDALNGGYEIASYSAMHKVKKDDDFYLCKIVKVW